MGSFILCRRSLVACLVIVAITVAISGCFGGGGSTGAVLKGNITQLDLENELRFEAGLFSSGESVSGAEVTLYGPESHVTTTDALGRFTLANVSPGTYNIMVRKSGFASVTAYNVLVTSYGTNEVELRMVKLPKGSSISDITPPTVQLGCPSRVVGTGYITVSAKDTSGIAGILLFIDSSYVDLFGTAAGGTYSWNTLSTESGADNGEHTITAMAIDEYGNIGYKSIVAKVDNFDVPVYPPGPPTNVKASAATIHYSVIDLLHALEEKSDPVISSSLADRILALIKNLNETTSLVRPLAMPAGSEAVAFCQVTWQTQDDLRNLIGFKICRDGVFIGESPAQSSGAQALVIQPRPPVPQHTLSYIDGSSKLTPNVPVSYRVSAYNRGGESSKSDSATTKPLGALTEVFLSEPYVDINGGFLRFTWSPRTNAKLYAFRLIEGSSGRIVEQIYQASTEASVDPNALDLDKEYHWYVLAIDSFPSPPSVFDPNTWSPSQMSVSGSELRSFILRTP